MLTRFDYKLGFGTCTTPMKLGFVRKAKVDPMFYQIFYSFAIFLTVIPVLSFSSGKLSYWGILGAAIWVPSSVLCNFGVRLLGLSVASGLWSVGTIVVGFLWGTIFFREEVPNIYLCILGIFLLCFGVLFLSTAELDFSIVSLCGGCFKKLVNHVIIISKGGREGRQENETTSLLNNENNNNEEVENSILEYQHNNSISNKNEFTSQQTEKIDERTKNIYISYWKKYILGVICVFLQSLLNGSMMVPSKMDEGGQDNNLYLFEFGLGCLIITPICFIIYFIIKTIMFQQPYVLEVDQLKASIVPGLMSGVLWSFGNYGTLLAIYSPLGLAIAVPMSQTSLVISGLSVLFILPGCLLLAIFGTSAS